MEGYRMWLRFIELAPKNMSLTCKSQNYRFRHFAGTIADYITSLRITAKKWK